MAGVRTVQEQIDESMSNDRFNAMVFAAFAAIALALASVGIYGVMSFVVAQRIHELGIRMALGADRKRGVQLILTDGTMTSLIGTVLGFAGAYYVGRAMQGLWFGVGTIDLGRFAAIALTLIAAALLACYVPARRAATVDPLVAPRESWRGRGIAEGRARLWASMTDGSIALRCGIGTGGERPGGWPRARSGPGRRRDLRRPAGRGGRRRRPGEPETAHAAAAGSGAQAPYSGGGVRQRRKAVHRKRRPE